MTQKSLFGVALAHTQRRFAETIETAQLADELGADLVTLADHPYVPNELETWTMLATLAAHTERVTLASNVVSLQLRAPAMLAKAAATLQFTSGGRFVLGLGSGDSGGSATFGGPSWTPGESVRALEEGVGLIRRLWQPGAGVDHTGEFFTLSGTQVSPKPDPQVPIWIGSFGPKMLAVTGRHADAWLPTNAYLNLDDVPGMQRRIDDAAVAAGRDPAQIRRVFNIFGQITKDGEPENGRRLTGPVDYFVETLRDYRDRLGFDSFVFWPSADRPEQTRLFLEEVRPELRP
ncbi:LLM class flavin-dependent oxidoreductase [Phytoactinopolyspora mesophila]|uniref:LLM class flavin-dependent oxidoreductase n=1 Tax=Phytoactinopolyspora mesophila TaxID=2650750 RepID=A0A7K3M9J2_9ACTN|nr:LLM class flavin-dependent oxidoreductase [Phytoactinopolyspora mesophila]NDL59632.1 LLM class flavin-dependent oxidoreductase [Phytoactinopolyspora mesophila]